MVRSGSRSQKQGVSASRKAPDPDPIEPYCIACGCTEFTPCETSSGPCGWHIVPHMSGRGMCTGCAHRYDNPARVFRQVEQLLNSWRRARVLNNNRGLANER